MLGLVLGNAALSLRSRYLQQAHRMLLGCAFRFYSGSGRASFFGILRILRIPRKTHLNLIIPGQDKFVPESSGTLNLAGIWREGPMKHGILCHV